MTVEATLKNRIYLSTPHMSGKELDYIKEAFETNWVAPLGPNVDAFENELASLVGVKGAVAVSSGTAAIHLALSLLNVQKGDTVFCSSFTFVASANPIIYQGAKPVFIDSEPETWNMSPQALEKAFQEAVVNNMLPKAVIVVHLFGQSAKMDEILSVCAKYDVPVIEDAAESLGAFYKGRASGTMGHFGVYSFNGNKIITTSGGGMLVSDDLELLEKARYLSTQARDKASHYEHSVLGYNYRLSNVLAGIGRAQLDVLSNRVKRRREIQQVYEQQLGMLEGVSFMPELEDTFSNRWLTALTIDEEVAGTTVLELLANLEAENIEARHVWKPLHMQRLFKDAKFFPHGQGNCVSERIFQTGICLPSGSNMTMDDQMRVIECVRKSLRSK